LEVWLIYYKFLKLKSILKLNHFWKNRNIQADMWQLLDAPRVMLTSAQGQLLLA